MASKQGSSAISSSRTRNGTGPSDNSTTIDIDGDEDRRAERFSELKITYPTGILPKMPKEDSDVNWPIVELKFKVYLRKFPIFYEILTETVGRDDHETAAQREKYGQKIEAVYSLIVEMAEQNETAINIVQTHFQTDPLCWPNTLWKQLVARFTHAQKHRVSEAIFAISSFSKKDDESHKGMVDRFYKCISDVRNIDVSQVPPESFLIKILKKSMQNDRS